MMINPGDNKTLCSTATSRGPQVQEERSEADQRQHRERGQGEGAEL